MSSTQSSTSLTDAPAVPYRVAPAYADGPAGGGPGAARQTPTASSSKKGAPPALSYREVLDRIAAEDEHVQIGLVTHHWPELAGLEFTWGSGESEIALDQLVTRALDRAAQEHVLWTPLLDSIASATAFGILPQVDRNVELLRAWIEEQRDADSLAPLVALKHPGLRRAAIVRRFVLDPRTGTSNISRDPSLWDELSRRSDLSDAHHAQLSAVLRRSAKPSWAKYFVGTEEHLLEEW